MEYLHAYKLELIWSDTDNDDGDAGGKLLFVIIWDIYYSRSCHRWLFFKSLIVCLRSARAPCQQKKKCQKKRNNCSNWIGKTNEKSRDTNQSECSSVVSVSNINGKSDECMKRHFEYFLRHFSKSIAMNESWLSQLTILPFTCFIFLMHSISHSHSPLHIRTRFCYLAFFVHFSFFIFFWSVQSLTLQILRVHFGKIIIYVSSQFLATAVATTARSFVVSNEITFFCLVLLLLSAAACCVVWVSRAVWVSEHL